MNKLRKDELENMTYRLNDWEGLKAVKCLMS